MKTNSVIALFIVVILIVTGLVLGAINHKSKLLQDEKPVARQTETTG
jgi:flagellar biosynthesis component FlhA